MLFGKEMVPLILSVLILVDMLAALSLGLTPPLSPTGMLGTLLALIIVLLLVINASDAWVVSPLMIFFVLT